MKTRQWLVCTMVLMLLSLGGCVQEVMSAPAQSNPAAKAEQKEIVLGFAQLGAESAWRTYNTESIKRAAQQAGIQLMFTDAEQKQENQIKAIRSFIAYQVDVIAFAPIVETNWDNVLIEAREAGIPVLLTDRFIQTEDDSLYAGYIGANFWEEGRNAARFLLEKFDRTTDDVYILEIPGTVDSSPARGRAEGFREVLNQWPNFHIIEAETGDFLRSKGREIMANRLSRLQKIDVVYCHNDGMALGAMEAIESAGLRPGEDIVIVSVDGEQEAIDALKAGKMNCIVECNPDLGNAIMDLTAKLARGEEIPRETYSEEMIFTEWDDLSAIAPRPY